MGERKSKS